MVGVVQVYSDLSLDCGALLRSYIKENIDKDWLNTPEAWEADKGDSLYALLPDTSRGAFPVTGSA